MEKAGELLKHYSILLDLYKELESVSGEICRALEDGVPVYGIVENLGEKKKIVEQIEKESQAIAALKKNVLDRNIISDDERTLIRDAEGNITETVTRIIELGKKTYELMTKHGIKVSRR